MPPEPEVVVSQPAVPSVPEPRAEAYVRPPAEEEAPIPNAPMRDVEPQVAVPKPLFRVPQGIVLGVGWVGLAAIVLVIVVSGLFFRQQIAQAWPQTAAIYSKLGMKVNASGLRFDNVRYRKEAEGGQVVLTVTGVLTNVSSRELPVPQIRVGLVDNDQRELYHWTFTPDVMTLRPGQTTRFVTRLSSPPEGARQLDVRFAKAGE
jgi:Protein of unknown function (DUF3426)